MDNNIIALRGDRTPQPPAQDFWFAHVDLRLCRIETTLTRLAWQIWCVVCGCAGLLVLEIISIISGGTP